jgi:hypothetical protein
MMQAPYSRQCQNPARWIRTRLDRARGRCFFLEPNVRSVLMVRGDVLTPKPEQKIDRVLVASALARNNPRLLAKNDPLLAPKVGG